ncbi:MAG: hypothetical protein QF830_08720, partial [Rhodospirillales bacterium]|nr:hypothetical protein [Rhodospirillales bacterium]
MIDEHIPDRGAMVVGDLDVKKQTPDGGRDPEGEEKTDDAAIPERSNRPKRDQRHTGREGSDMNRDQGEEHGEAEDGPQVFSLDTSQKKKKADRQGH